MPILKQAKKALRQSEKRAVRNKIVKDEISSNKRYFRKAIEANDATKAEELYHKIGKMIDKATKNNVFHKNNAARIKSRMMQKLNAIKKK
ncbi:MAG: 30S ribosomal protein S20 [Candidatus Uhrbacteria bacterium]